MPRKHLKSFENFDNAEPKRRLMIAIGTLSGPYSIDIKPVSPAHSDAQRGYFHGVVVQSLYEFLNDPGHGDGTHYSFDQCKDLIVARVMGLIPIVNPTTGELVGEVRPSTANLSAEDYSPLIEGAILYLAETFGILVPPPSLHFKGGHDNKPVSNRTNSQLTTRNSR